MKTDQIASSATGAAGTCTIHRIGAIGDPSDEGKKERKERKERFSPFIFSHVCLPSSYFPFFLLLSRETEEAGQRLYTTCTSSDISISRSPDVPSTHIVYYIYVCVCVYIHHTHRAGARKFLADARSAQLSALPILFTSQPKSITRTQSQREREKRIREQVERI